MRNTTKKNFTTLNALRVSMFAEDRAILDQCWGFYNREGTHIPKAEIYHAFGRPAAEIALRRLPHSVIHAAWGNGGDTFQLTLLGALATSQGAALEELLVTYLSAIRKSYDDDHRRSYLSYEEFNRFAKMPSNLLHDLGRLLTLGIRLVGTSASSGQNGAWAINISAEVEDVRRIDDPKDYIEKEVLAQAKELESNSAFPYGNAAASPFLESGYSFLLEGALPSANGRDATDASLDLQFMADSVLRDVCQSDWNEALAASSRGLLKASMLLCGAVAEGLLLDCLEQLEPADVENARIHMQLPKRPLEEIGLDGLIKLARTLGAIKSQSTHLTQFLREYRNNIHPARQRKERDALHNDHVTIALAAIRSLARELSRESRP